MTLLKGHPVGGPVVPYTSADIYATHKALYGMGGLRTVPTLYERNTIPLQRRELHMVVAVEGNGLMYEFVVWSDADYTPDSCWRVFPYVTDPYKVDYDEDLTGDKDGVNVDFYTSSNFIVGSTKVYYNGVRQKRGYTFDYIEIGNDRVRFVMAPVERDYLIVEYQEAAPI